MSRTTAGSRVQRGNRSTFGRSSVRCQPHVSRAVYLKPIRPDRQVNPGSQHPPYPPHVPFVNIHHPHHSLQPSRKIHHKGRDKPRVSESSTVRTFPGIPGPSRPPPAEACLPPTHSGGVPGGVRGRAQKKVRPFDLTLKRRLPTLPRDNRSTIGVSELNFSVRNGKRWNLTAITT